MVKPNFLIGVRLGKSLKYADPCSCCPGMRNYEDSSRAADKVTGPSYSDTVSSESLSQYGGSALFLSSSIKTNRKKLEEHKANLLNNCKEVVCIESVISSSI